MKASIGGGGVKARVQELEKVSGMCMESKRQKRGKSSWWGTPPSLQRQEITPQTESHYLTKLSKNRHMIPVMNK